MAYREEKPADYLKVIASLLPKEAGKAEKVDGVEALSDGELLARISTLDAAIAALATTLPPLR